MARWFGARDPELRTRTTRTTKRTTRRTTARQQSPTRTPRTRTEDEVRAFLRLLPRYRVLLYNDDVNTFDHVIATLVRVIPSLSLEGAERIAWTAHTTGLAEVIICLKEQAEHYCLCLERAALTSTIEPA